MKVLSKYAKILEYDNKVLYANSESGKWLRVSDEVSKIISIYLEDSSEDFLERVEFESENDEKFFFNIIDKLVQYEILREYDERYKCDNSVTIEITNDCNLRCKHCCVNAGEEKDYEFSFEELKGILTKCIGILRVSLQVVENQ